MSFPEIPNVTPSITITREETVNLLLASIAFEELGLAHIINAEGEKIQAALGTLPNSPVPPASSISDLIAIDQSVNQMLKTVIRKEMLLQMKLEDILEFLASSSTTTSSSTSSTSSTTSSTSSTTSSTSSSTTSSTSSTSTSTSTTTSTTSTSSTTTSPPLSPLCIDSVFANNNFSIASESVLNANVQVNGNLTVTHSGNTFLGTTNVSGGFSDSGGNTYDNLVLNAPMVPYPVFNTDCLLGRATLVLTGDQNIASAADALPYQGQTVFVMGNVNITGSGISITGGGIFATGTITVSGGDFSYTSTDCFALYSDGGDIRINNGPYSIKGLLYTSITGGDIRLATSQGGSICGSLFSGRDIILTGGSAVHSINNQGNCAICPVCSTNPCLETGSTTTTTSSSTTTTTTSTTTTSTSTESTTSSSSSTTTESTTTSTSSSSTTTETTTSTTSTSSSTTTLSPTTNVATASTTFDNGNAVTFSSKGSATYSSSAPFTGGYMVSGPSAPQGSTQPIVLGGVNLGQLPNYLFFFDNGSVDANWQGATKGMLGNVAVNGIVASERTSGDVPYAGTIFTNDVTLGAWQNIINQNVGQATGVTGQTALLTTLHNELIGAFQQINGLPATPGYTSIDSSALDGLNTQNGINETFVINITSGFQVSSQLNVTGDPGDVYILRWDTDANPTNGYQGQVKFQSGGAIVPHGGLTPSNFISVAGDIDASGGGINPPAPYPQGPYNNGSLIAGGADFTGGGFFTGYWLTTGAPTNFDPTTGLFFGGTHSLSNAIFVGGWYSITDAFSMTSGTSGTAVPNLVILKEVSVDNGMTFNTAPNPPGPTLPPGVKPIYRYRVTNIGGVTLTNIAVSDNVVGTIGTIPSLGPSEFASFIAMGV